MACSSPAPEPARVWHAGVVNVDTADDVVLNVELITLTNDQSEFGPISLQVAVAGPDDGPLILCVHGWPETWHSWRFQMEHFAAQGFRVAAMNVRGYPGSSTPADIAAYRLSELAGDTAAVIAHIGGGAPAILFGHDWGAPIVWQTARLHPDSVRAVAGLSVPYRPTTPGDPMQLWEALYADRFFYMKYFQEPGVAEAAFGADIDTALRKVYYAGSADGWQSWFAHHPADHAFLDGLVDPDPAPKWMAPDALAPTLEEFAGHPLHGLFNRYRAQGLDAEELPGMAPDKLAQPVCFIGGAEDIVRKFVPGVDVFQHAGNDCDDFRGLTIIEGSGHWVQQEKPHETNVALDAFVSSFPNPGLPTPGNAAQ